MRACHAQPKSLLNIKNVARQDALNASLYGLDRNQSTHSRHVQSTWFSVDTMIVSHYTDVHRSKPAWLIYSMDCFKRAIGPSIIVISRFLESPQKRCRRNQLIHRRLIKTKIDRPIQKVRCLELGRDGDIRIGFSATGSSGRNGIPLEFHGIYTARLFKT